MDLDIIEMRIKFLETILKRYSEISTKTGYSIEAQEETTNLYLDELSKLYKERNKLKNRKK